MKLLPESFAVTDEYYGGEGSGIGAGPGHVATGNGHSGMSPRYSLYGGDGAGPGGTEGDGYGYGDDTAWKP